MTTHSSLISPTMPSSVSWTEWITVEDAVAAVILIAALVIGLATAGDYGATIDEFNANDYGPKALAWYTSGFADRSQFETVEFSLWYYGPWFQIVTATVQSLSLAEPLTVRHAMTFVLTGYLYGNLFFAPIDSPFLATMSALGELSIRFISVRCPYVLSKPYCYPDQLRAKRSFRSWFVVAVTMMLAWIVAWALWPWLQIGNPAYTFRDASGGIPI